MAHNNHDDSKNGCIAGSKAACRQTGTGKTTRLTTVMTTIHTESDPKWIDPKANGEDATDRSES